MIILEGPDGAGKTTLRDQLLERIPELEKMPRAVTSDATSLFPIGKYIEDELDKGFGNRLYDRFAIISSPMYLCLPNPTFVDPLTNVDWLMMQWHKVEVMDPAIIYCMPPLEVVRANVLGDDSSEVMWPFIDQIYHHYVAHIARNWSTSSMIYDYTNPNLTRLESLTKWVLARTEREKNDREHDLRVAGTAATFATEDASTEPSTS